MKSRESTAAARRRARARAKKHWDVRRTIAAPRSSFEELEIRTADGAALRALVDDPPEGRELRGAIVLAHAMFASKSAFGLRDAPGLSTALAGRGFRTIAFDFRGHGDSSVTRARWGYDDLVRHDLPAVVEYARSGAEGRPVLVVGHALGAHAALAAHGTGRITVDAIVALATNVWVRDPWRLGWAARSALARVARELTARAGDLATRLIDVRSDEMLERHVLRRVIPDRGLGLLTGGRWTSADGTDDYLAALARVDVPVAAVVAERDRLRCPPAAGEAFARRCAGRVAAFRAPVGHVDIVTSRRAEAAVIDAVEWALDQARP